MLDDALLFVRARKAANFTQDDWARLLHVRPATVWRWEHGQRRLTDREKAMVRMILATPMLRRRVYMQEDDEALLILGGLVEPIEASLATYRQLRAFLREIKVLKRRASA